jgi:hypothetical protein
MPEATPDSVRLGDVLHLRRSLATGSNAFFCLSEQARRDAGIPKSYVRPVLASGRNLPTDAFTQGDWQQRLDASSRTLRVRSYCPTEPRRH